MKTVARMSVRIKVSCRRSRTRHPLASTLACSLLLAAFPISARALTSPITAALPSGTPVSAAPVSRPGADGVASAARMSMSTAAGDVAAQASRPSATGAADPAPQTPPAAPRAGAPAGTPTSPQALTAAIDKLGSLDFPIRMQASRTVRRTSAAQAVPALIKAVQSHADGYVRYRALVLLSGFGDPRVHDVMASVLDDKNDRLRTVAYSYFAANPDPALAAGLLTKLEPEDSEFVRPSLVRALAALETDPKVQPVLLREVNRGQDFFRSTVIEALGDYRAAYAVPALLALAKVDGPLQDDAVVALGQIGDKKSLDTIAALQRSAPRERQPALAASICLLGVNCDTHERFLVETLKFSVKNAGFQDLIRSAARGLSHLAIAGRDFSWDSLIQVGQETHDPARAPIALALASAAIRSPERILQAIERAANRQGALGLLRDGFDMLEEDFAEEQFYIQARSVYWKLPQGSPTRKAAEAMITTLEF